MRLVYTLLLYLLVPWIVVRLVMRGFANHAYFRRWAERFGFVATLREAPVLWVHAVSVGETRAAAPLIKALLERYPGYRVLVTTMTPTGSDQVRNLFGASVSHCYVPYDLPGPVGRFLNRVRPQLALIMETELWPNLFHSCRRRGTPLAVVNVRLSERSMRGYLRFQTLARSTLEQVDRFGAQTEDDAARIIQVGAIPAKVKVTGNIKFELDLPGSLREVAEVLRREWGQDRPVWVAASTRDGEEAMLLKVLPELKQQFPGLLLVLVPRHPERFAEVAQLCKRAGHEVALRTKTQGTSLDPKVDIFVGDTMGELMLFYAAADVAFIGGSLVATGGHNLLEACAVGVPVIFGPHMFNFMEISRLTLERGAGVQVEDEHGVARVVAAYLADPNKRFETGENGRKLVEGNRGALQRTLALVDEIFS